MIAGGSVGTRAQRGDGVFSRFSFIRASRPPCKIDVALSTLHVDGPGVVADVNGGCNGFMSELWPSLAEWGDY